MKVVPSFKLTQEGSDIIVNAAIEKAKELKQIVSIAVVDAGGHLFAFKRMTNGRTHNTLLALAKARGAALTTAATGKKNREGAEIPDHQVLAQTLGVRPGWFISIEGGIPITEFEDIENLEVGDEVDVLLERLEKCGIVRARFV